jgi:hypothetical protein
VARDFKTFYCAGATANADQNPYLETALERCGYAKTSPLPGFVRNGVWAAPLPPYDIAFFRILATLPYYVAAQGWLVLSIMALLLAVAIVSQLSGLAPLAVFCAFAMPLFYTNLQWGQLPPIAIAALGITAFALSRQVYGVAGVASVATLIEPHIGAPVCIAVFLWAPRTRVAIAAGIALLVLVSISTAGISTNIAYLRTILPLQALAEVPASNQYSLTWLAYFCGVSENFAITVGSISYVVMAVLGVWLARNTARSLNAEHLLPVVPAALAVLGGAFVHQTQASISILLGILLLRYVGRSDPVLWAAILLQVPLWYVDAWLTHPYTPVRIESTLAAATCAFFAVVSWSLRRRLAAALAAGVVYLAITLAILHLPRATIRMPETAAIYARKLGPNREYTTGAWGIHIRADKTARESSLLTVGSKLPIWAGLIWIVLIAVTVSNPLRRRKTPAVVRALAPPSSPAPQN